MNQQIDINRILQILGAKEVEVTVLRERIQQAEQYEQKIKMLEDTIKELSEK
jgi:hypothetical protein